MEKKIEYDSYVEGLKDGIQAERDGVTHKEFKLDEERIESFDGSDMDGERYSYHYPEEKVKEFIKQRLYAATKLLALFNQDKLTSMDLREHRQNIKDDAGGKLI